MRLPRRFIWQGEEDSTRSHLALKKDGIYSCGDISSSLLIAWANDGLLKFLTDEEGEDIPPETVIQVHNVSISLKTVMGRIKPEPKEEDHG